MYISGLDGKLPEYCLLLYKAEEEATKEVVKTKGKGKKGEEGEKA